MIDINAALSRIQDACPGVAMDAVLGPAGEWFVELPSNCLVDAVQALTEDGALHHLSAISGMAQEGEFQVLYHLWVGGGITLRVRCPMDDAVLPSLSELMPIAQWYEREVHDMFGTTFEGHPALSPLLLPEDWEGPPPMSPGGPAS